MLQTSLLFPSSSVLNSPAKSPPTLLFLQDVPSKPEVRALDYRFPSSNSETDPSSRPIKDRVFGAAQGAYAEQIVADYKACLPVPEGMSYEQAAGLFVTYPTSYEGLVGRGEAKKGDWVLVHAGAGGVGMAAVQIAKCEF